jgi:AraC-like DNA-binding protein
MQLHLDESRLHAFKLVRANSADSFEECLRAVAPFPDRTRTYGYRLLDPTSFRTRFDHPILSLAVRCVGPFVASYGSSSLATEITHEGAYSELINFVTVLQGTTALTAAGLSGEATVDRGLVFRPRNKGRLLTSDQSVRTNFFIKAKDLETALEHMLDTRLHGPLEFHTEIDWSRGLAASLKWQLGFMMQEMERPDGLASNTVALASMTDLLVTLALRAAPHNYTDQLTVGPAAAVPAYVRRAEEFMRAHCAEPIRITDIAAAAGCSVRTLSDVFSRFRGRSTLAILQGIRLEKVHAELSLIDTGATVGAVARRYGFTNASRLKAAFKRRFGETPSDVVRRALR